MLGRRKDGVRLVEHYGLQRTPQLVLQPALIPKQNGQQPTQILAGGDQHRLGLGRHSRTLQEPNAHAGRCQLSSDTNNLVGELGRRYDHEHLPRLVWHEPGHEWQQVSECLPAASLSVDGEAFAQEEPRHRRGLNWQRLAYAAS